MVFQKGHPGGPGRPKGSGKKTKITVDADTPLEELAEIGIRALLMDKDPSLKAKGVAGLRALKDVRVEPEPEAVCDPDVVRVVGLFRELCDRTGLSVGDLIDLRMRKVCLVCERIGCEGMVE